MERAAWMECAVSRISNYTRNMHGIPSKFFFLHRHQLFQAAFIRLRHNNYARPITLLPRKRNSSFIINGHFSILSEYNENLETKDEFEFQVAPNAARWQHNRRGLRVLLSSYVALLFIIYKQTGKVETISNLTAKSVGRVWVTGAASRRHSEKITAPFLSRGGK